MAGWIALKALRKEGMALHGRLPDILLACRPHFSLVSISGASGACRVSGSRLLHVSLLAPRCVAAATLLPWCSWDQGTAAARQEITRTYKALKDIHSNITQVQSSVSAADSALKAAAEAAQLERELEQQLQKLILGLQQQQQDLQAQLEARQLAEQQLEVCVRTGIAA